MGNTSPYRASRTALSASNSSKKTTPVKAEEFKFFNQLPAVLKGAISGSLSTKDAAHLSCSSRGMNFLLHHPPAVPMTVRQFLLHVVRGEHATMQNMLRGTIHLLHQRGVVTDCSGREFGSISGFEYALWALDKHQWEDMLACLPKDGRGRVTEEGQQVVKELLRQYTQIKEQKERVIYRLNEETKAEFHYDFALINELQKQVNAQIVHGPKYWNGIDKQWREGVGGAQRLAPVHVVDEYCSNRPFFPMPKFNSRPQPANGLRQFYNWFSGCWSPWFGPHSKLGDDFAIHKARFNASAEGVARCGRPQGGAPRFDLTAMEALRKIRTQDFSLLEAQLNSLLDLEEQPHLGIDM